MKFVGRIPRSSIAGGAVVRVKYPPFDVLVAQASRRSEDSDPGGFIWAPLDRLDEFALPSVMHKVVKVALTRSGKGHNS